MLKRLLSRLTGAQQDELAPSLLAAACFFCILFAAFMLRPLRESMGLRSGIDALHTLYLGTLALMVVANIIYAALVARFRRASIITIFFRAAMLCIALFAFLLYTQPAEPSALLGNTFFIWFSVFNVLATSVFWQLMADTHSLENSKRLFGFIGVGGTLGAIAGSAYAWQLAEILGPAGLMLCAILLLEAAAQLAKRISANQSNQTNAHQEPIGGSPFAAFKDILQSPYLIAIAAYILLFTICSTLLWFQKMRIVNAAVEGTNAQTATFAAIELAAQSATVILQLCLTSRIIRLLGVGKTLAIVPLITVAGFVALALSPTILIYTIFEATRKASNYALSKPARETLFTVVPREDKYKAKALIDTFVYRAGDVVGTGVDLALAAAAALIAAAAIPLASCSLALAISLGVMQRRKANTPE